MIDELYKMNNDIYKFLLSNRELTYHTKAQDDFRKVLLLSAASLFEHMIKDIILRYASKHSEKEEIVELLRNKAIERQYHTYFDWDSNNINKFLGLFGERFKENAKKEISLSEELRIGITSFLRLGLERNLMVHNNFLAYKLNLTDEEIFTHYKNALEFINYIEDRLC